ncbi:MAG TPA: NusG domain II-containing protein [Clostridiales bacterium]|nr:NusG domain II-containing protein [Clostridiales bacterium]
MKKNDYYLIGIILIMSLLSILTINSFKKEGTKVVVYIDGEVYKTFDLDEGVEHTIDIDADHWNKFIIKDGKVDMIDASCPDLICVKDKPIHYNNEIIVCLPNKVVIEIVGGKDNPIDSIVN